MPLMGMFIFLVLFCGAIIFVMYRLLGGQAKEAADRFAALTEDFDAKRAELKKLEQDTVKKSENMLNFAKQQCEQMKSQAALEVEKIRGEGAQQARKEAERIVNDAVKARDAMRLELEQEMRLRMIDAACGLVLRVFPESLRHIMHDFWIEDLLNKGLAALDRVDSRETIQKIELETAFPLNEKQREKIVAAVEKKLGDKLPLTEKVLPEAVGGLRIKLGHLILEGTFSSKLKEATLDVRNNRA